MGVYKILVFAKYFSMFIKCLEKVTSSTFTFYIYITVLDSKSQKIPKARGLDQQHRGKCYHFRKQY